MKKNTLNRITGKSKGNGVLLSIGAGLTIIVIVATIALTVHYIQLDQIQNLRYLLPLYVFSLVLPMIYINVFFVKRKYVKEQQERFSKLSAVQQQEIITLAEQCKGDAMYFNERYVYGNIQRVKKPDAEIMNTGSAFEYIPLNQISWVHMLEQTASISSISRMGTTHAARLTDRFCCVYDYKGQCYRGRADQEFMNGLKPFILKENPSCKFGYTKELQKENASRRRNYQ